jgi:Soluble lytic murein transglycosylase and related regulatory proteins (some contain LysM/invasin domains)
MPILHKHRQSRVHLLLSLTPALSRTLVAATASVALCSSLVWAGEATPTFDSVTAQLALIDREALSPDAGASEANNASDVQSLTSQSDSTEIRIRIHTVEAVSSSEEDSGKTASTEKNAAKQNPAQSDTTERDVPVLSEADEIKKQAQAKYLAAKLKKHERTVRKYVDLAWEEAGKRRELDPELLIAIIKKESEFRPRVQSPYGAQGLMQVVRRWHRDKLHPSESLFDPAVNIRVGADVLEEYLEMANGDVRTALKKYSGNSKGYVNTVLKETQALARVAEQAAAKSQVASRSTSPNS